MVKRQESESAEIEHVAEGTISGVLTGRFDNDALREIKSFEAAVNAIETEYGRAVLNASEEFGTGFIVLDGDQKDKLVGVPFVILEWRFHSGDYGEFVSAPVITAGNERYILNDGSSGIFHQLRTWTFADGVSGGVLAPMGLRKSEYDTCFECGVPMSKEDTECERCHYTGDKRNRGKTFYLAV